MRDRFKPSPVELVLRDPAIHFLANGVLDKRAQSLPFRENALDLASEFGRDSKGGNGC